jgi:hypothetical protein
VLEGRVKLKAPSVEMELDEGQAARISDRFELLMELPSGDLDAWSEQRDREAAERAPELEAHGKWMEAPGLGKVWRPEAQNGFVPFRAGRWRWYDGLGFTWIAAEPWGWRPYHSGRWARLGSAGWVWKPGEVDEFHGGEAYWVRGPNFVAWGPLAPGEVWRGEGPPVLREATTFAAYGVASRELDPARVPHPRGAGQWVTALPAPPFFAAAQRKGTRVGTTRVMPASAENAYDSRQTEPPPLIVTLEPPSTPSVVIETVRVPEPVYVPVPEVVVVEREVPAPPAPAPEPESEPERPRPRPQPEVRPRPAPVTPPVVERTIRLRDPEAGEARSRRR